MKWIVERSKERTYTALIESLITEKFRVSPGARKLLEKFNADLPPHKAGEEVVLVSMFDEELMKRSGGTDELHLRRDSAYRLVVAAQQGLLPCPPDLAMEFLRQQLKNPRGVFLVAMEPRKIAGCAAKIVFSVGGKKKACALNTEAVNALPRDCPWLYLQEAPAR